MLPLGLLLTGTCLIGCSSGDAAASGLDGVDSKLQESVVSVYAEIAHRNYEDALQAARRLNEATSDFVNGPSEETLRAARDAWLEAREPYLQTEVFRFYGGPIDDEDGPEGSINAWPLDEAYIDYVKGGDEAGIVNDPDVDLEADVLDGLNGKDGVDENVATGYHAIEFLLWGQDQNDDGPGERPYTDYVTTEDATAKNQERRGEMLKVLSSLLVSHLESVAVEWEAGEDNYRRDFEADAKVAITNMLTGMIVLSGFETGGERLVAALDSGSQEQEHSCFSDNTHRDMIQDIQGVKNVYEGTYEDLSGKEFSGSSLYELVAQQDQGLANELRDQIEKSLQLANKLDVPFDQSIALDNEMGRSKVEALVASLQKQEGTLEDVFRLLELSVPVIE